MRVLLTLLRFFSVLLTLHFLEVAVWAEFYFLQHCFPDRETAYFFSLKSYTTLGYGDVVISHPWRLMGVRGSDWNTPDWVVHGHHSDLPHPLPGSQREESVHCRAVTGWRRKGTQSGWIEFYYNLLPPTVASCASCTMLLRLCELQVESRVCGLATGRVTEPSCWTNLVYEVRSCFHISQLPERQSWFRFLPCPAGLHHRRPDPR